MTGLTVPEGHRVGVHRMGPLPYVGRCDGGAWLAHQGLGSDELDLELGRMLEEVEALACGPRPRVALASFEGGFAGLFQPSSPEVLDRPGELVWTFDAAALAGAPDAPTIVQELLRRVHALRVRAAPALSQTAFLADLASPRARAIADLLLGLGIQVRLADPIEGAVLVEVHRPDGMILTALAGSAYWPAEAPDAYPRNVNQEKDLAEQQGAPERLQRIREQELAYLEKRLAPAQGEPKISVVKRAPRLRRLLLAVADGSGADAARALEEELLRREVPLLVFVDPATKASSLSSFPRGVVALSVYGDESSFLRTARDLGMNPGSFAMAAMPPRDLFAWAAGHGWGVALNAFRAPDRPIYIPIPPADVQCLARGEAPSSRS